MKGLGELEGSMERGRGKKRQAVKGKIAGKK